MEGSKHRDLCAGSDQAAVPRLILLNGPPRIGKSTLARLNADDHPGVLNLDIDRVRALIGGWLDRFAETGAADRGQHGSPSRRGRVRVVSGPADLTGLVAVLSHGRACGL